MKNIIKRIRDMAAVGILFSLLMVPPAAQATMMEPASKPRQQTNVVTSYLDGSVIYGSDASRAASLRTFSGGRLATSEGNLLPLNSAGLPNANDAHIVPDNQLFLAGEVRANENIELSAVQTLFLREHNLIADAIASANPGLKDEEIYQRARKIVRAELQVITYNEFLPALLGNYALRPYKGYQPNVNPGIANEFSAAAFRVGHTMINNEAEFLDNDGQAVREAVDLANEFFNPTSIHELGIDPLIKYLASDNAQEIDLKVVDGLRNFLFGAPGAGGFDLPSRNIQRGRDHGLADFNTVREAYGLEDLEYFNQITGDVAVQKSLRSLYGSVNNIDLWVGCLAEDHVPGASVGPTLQRVIAKQFERIRDGDRFWYQRLFSGATLAALESTQLSDIIRRNTTITKIQDNVFFFDPDTTIAGLVPKPGSLPPALAVVSGGAVEISFDGGANNLAHPAWGQAGTELLRTAPAAYADGISAPGGQNRPSARLISNTVNAQTDVIPNGRLLSPWIYAWGQFVDHDLDLTTTGSTPFNIAVPAGDPFFDPANTGTQVITLMRSNFSTASSTPNPPSVFTFLRIMLPPHDRRNVILSIKTNDPVIIGNVSDGRLEVTVNLPSGPRMLTMSEVPNGHDAFFAKVSTSSLSSEDIALRHGAIVEITVGGTNIAAVVQLNTITNALGGRVCSGNITVIVNEGHVTGEGQVEIRRLESDSVRKAALAKQKLMLLGEESDFTLTSGELITASISLPFDPSRVHAGLSLAKARVAYYNPARGEWEIQDNASVQGDQMEFDAKHFSIYAPVLEMPEGTPEIKNLYVYPNPALETAHPVIHVKMGPVDNVEIDIYDVSGTRVHSASFPGDSPQIGSDGESFYEYVWNDAPASGVYIASIKGKTSTATVKDRVKFAVVK